MASTSRAGDAGPAKKWPGRMGIVVLQFDDGTAGHFTHAFPILEKYGLKGSFGVVTGNLGRSGSLAPDQVAEMHQAGHEIHDHTLDHNAAMWGDPSRKAEWAEHTEKSLKILRDLGITTRGWNHPGGKGSQWTSELHEFLLPGYDYVAGRVNLKPEERYNIHWNLKDHPFSLGYGGLGSIPRRDSIDASRDDIAGVKTRIADGIQQGLVVIPLWHTVKDEDGTAWGVEEICKFVRRHNLPTMLMADAVRAIQHPRAYFDEQVEQIANPGFLCDYDENGRPDGYEGCRYASDDIRDTAGGLVAEFESGGATWIYGPEPGATRFSLRARSAEGKPCKLVVTMTSTEIDKDYRYRFGEPRQVLAADLGATWSEHEAEVTVGPEVDRIRIVVETSPLGKIQVSRLSWRRSP
ncbi:MAG: polysaccharide deacetylase family protein [Planctomycetaceae bacterium]|nr:polysaccharide deacetylase family protein [Planctomycetaceae bacterium]